MRIDPPEGLLDEWLSDVRIDVVTIFPEYLEPLRAALLGGPIERGLIRSGCTTCGTGRTTCTARWTTAPTAAAPAW